MFRSRNQVVLPLEIEKFIPQNDPVFKLVEICEKLDYSNLKKEYVRSWRKLDPATIVFIGLSKIFRYIKIRIIDL